MKKNKKQKDSSGDSLSKYLAQAGIASRRQVVDLIKQGLVKVNDIVITNPAHRIAHDDKISYQNKNVVAQKKVYIILNKPKNYVTTVSDEKERKTVLDLIKPPAHIRIYPVGRLDRDTTGLLLLTNDGLLAQKLAHPRHGVQKTYMVTLDRILEKDHLQAIQKGIRLFDGFIKVDGVYYMPKLRRNNIKVVLHSGKNRIVRRIFEHFGYTVTKLDRIGYANLTKKDLKVGQWRFLTPHEIETLKTAL